MKRHRCHTLPHISCSLSAFSYLLSESVLVASQEEAKRCQLHGVRMWEVPAAWINSPVENFPKEMWLTLFRNWFENVLLLFRRAKFVEVLRNLKKIPPVPGQLATDEMRQHLLRISLRYTMLVTLYHRIFAIAQDHVINDPTITCITVCARPDHVIYTCHYMALCGTHSLTDSRIQPITHLGTQSRTHAHIPGILMFINPIAFN